MFAMIAVIGSQKFVPLYLEQHNCNKCFRYVVIGSQKFVPLVSGTTGFEHFAIFQWFIPKITIKKRRCSEHGILPVRRDFYFLKQF